MHTLSLHHLYPHLSLSLCYNQKLQYTEEKKKRKFNIFLKKKRTPIKTHKLGLEKMPNVACNTSSFLKSNCKYTRTAKSESRSQLNNRWWYETGGRGLCRCCLPEGTVAKLTHLLVKVCFKKCAGALDSQNEPALHLESDRRTDAGLWKLMSTTEKL